MRILTLDASVFVAAARPMEPEFAPSQALLAWVRRQGPRLVLPTLLLPEVAAALSRTGSEPRLAQQLAMAISHLPNIVWASLDEGMARQAALLGALHRLRGADAVYLATASLFAAELISLDREQVERGSSIVRTLTPSEFMAGATP